MSTATKIRYSLYKVVFVTYLLTLIWLVLFKFSLDLSALTDLHTRSLNLIPFAGLSKDQLLGMVENFVIFIPFGLLLSIMHKNVSLRHKLAFMCTCSVAAEIIQFAFAIGATDITDVITNTLGGLAGLTLYGFGATRIHTKRLDHRIIVASSILLGLLFTILFTHSVRFQMSHQLGPAQVQLPLTTSAQLAWPTSGQAAVGTVENGLLARSSAVEKSRPIASMAKVITALAILKKQPLHPGKTGPTYTVTAEDVANYRAYAAKGGSTVPVHEGMALTEYQALQAMLIPSANNIADMLTLRVFGSKEAYISYAQNMVKQMGLSQTVISDASGFSAKTVSTPSELITIGIAALKDPVIAEIVSQSDAQLPGIGTVTNTNALLGTNGVVGIKTGTTDQAGNCLLFAARYTTSAAQNVTIVGVIMGDSDGNSLFADSDHLLASIKNGLNPSNAQSTTNNPQYDRANHTPQRLLP